MTALIKAMQEELKAARAWRDLSENMLPVKDIPIEQLLFACKEARERFDNARKLTEMLEQKARQPYETEFF